MQSRIGNPFAGKEKNEHLSADHALHKLIDALHAHREALRVWTPPYEYSQPYTIGGPQITGGGVNYSVASPFETWCEYSVVQVSFIGAGPFASALSSASAATVPTSTSTMIDRAGRDYIPYASNVAINLPQTDSWYPLPAGQLLYWVMGSGGAGFVTVQFRRRVNPAGIYSESNS